MTAIFTVKTTIELIAILLIIWGFLHEDKFIAFEDKLFRAIGINIRNRRRRKAAEKRRRLRLQEQRMNPRPLCAQPSPPVLAPVQSPVRSSGYWVA